MVTAHASHLPHAKTAICGSFVCKMISMLTCCIEILRSVISSVPPAVPTRGATVDDSKIFQRPARSKQRGRKGATRGPRVAPYGPLWPACGPLWPVVARLWPLVAPLFFYGRTFEKFSRGPLCGPPGHRATRNFSKVRSFRFFSFFGRRSTV